MNQDNLTKQIKDFLNSINNGTEFEIRFGKYNRQRFESNVDIDFFYRLKLYLDKNTPKEQKNELYTKETSHSNSVGKGQIRRILSTDANYKNPQKESILLKNSYRKYDNFDYDIRFSLASEKTLSKERVNGVDWQNPDFFRFKHRMTYLINVGKIDLTIVKEGVKEDNTKLKYEVELEVNKNSESEVLEWLTHLLEIKQNNLFVISSNEKQDIYQKYKALTNVPYFIGVQPETLQKDQLNILYSNLYSVTDKADGDRFFLFIDENGKVFFIDNNITNTLKTDVYTEKFNNCLIDGELIRTFDEQGNLTNISFYAFDVLFFDKFDIREDKRYLFKERLNKLLSIISSCICPSGGFSVYVKKFIFRNVFMGSEIIMKDVHKKPYENDGLIFTPMNEPYPKNKKWPMLLKWKPANQNTIDFFAVKTTEKSNDEPVWELYVQDHVHIDKNSKTNSSNSTTKVLFDIKKLCPDLPLENEITFKTTIADNVIDPTTKEPYQTMTVIEFKWEHNHFVPMRTRWDKTSNPRKHGNFSHVACSIWSNIHNPVTEDVLFHQMTNNTTQQVDGSKNTFFFDRMNTFHNKIKKYLTSKYLTDEIVVELCPGRSDLSYYSDFKNTLHSFEFESKNSKNNIREACKNVKNLNLSSYDFSEVAFDKLLEKSSHSLYGNVFSSDITKFFESDENNNTLISFLTHRMSKTGKFIVTFIDSDLFQCKGAYINENEVMYNINENNNKTLLFVNGLTYENEPIPLYKKLTTQSLIALMNKIGFDCVETSPFATLYNHDMFQLTQYEQNISHSMVYCVFSRNSQEQVGTFQHSPITVKKTKVFDTEESLPIVLNIKHISKNKNICLYKLSCLSDVSELLNCEKFKYPNPKQQHTFDYNQITNYLFNIGIDFTELTNLNILQDKKQLVLYNYKYTTESEKQLTETEEPIEETEITFVVLYKKQIFYDLIHLEEELRVNPTEIEVNQTEIEVNPTETEKSKKEKIRVFLKGKTTVVTLKEVLKDLNLKTSGNKKELILRLENYLG
jgi:hypothetical protein